MKYTLIKAHTPPYFDGYGDHNHFEILALPPAVYLNKINSEEGKIYPGSLWKDLVINPWNHPWIRNNITVVGYDFLEKVDAEHNDLYAFGSYHDGIDAEPTADCTGNKVADVKTSYVNIMGYVSTAEIYEIDSADLLKDDECWLMQPITQVWMRGKVVNGVSYCDLPYRGVASGSDRQIQWNQNRRSAYWLDASAAVSTATKKISIKVD